ncbi:hypothetical protein PsYK624_142600 [Phanerochaete sordida]|uniref:Uncharacterized protein n=1 Tax=Phanerochaete sordida TaxID=48140 RepID=A0A9P3LK21_9APHY|nr:hypothetical protein PsYK624_142600 [Phanerochaete sordida]
MRFTQTLYFVAAALASPSLASAAKRQSPSDPVIMTTPAIVSPTAGTVMAAEVSTTFTIGVPEYSHCHPGYTPVDVYLLAAEPTASSINSTYQFADYLHYFGSYVVTNIQGLPPMGTPPPTSLTMPSLGAEYEGQSVYLAIMQAIFDCPPNGYTEYAYDSKQMVYTQ